MSDTRSKAAEELVLLGQAGWSEPAIKAQLERLFSSPVFFDSEQARAILLPYLIEEALAGRVPDAASVTLRLGKLVFDSRTPNARVAVGRLRKKMKSYYAKPAKGDIRLVIPPKSYVVLAPRNIAASTGTKGPLIASILEPADKSEVYSVAKVRGRIEALDPDFRTWLVVFAPDGFYYPQCRVSRRSPSWQYEVRIGRMQWGETDGVEFDILLVAADFDGDFDFHGYTKRCGDGFGTRLPTDTQVLDTKTVIRRDIRTDGPITDRLPLGLP